MDLDSFENYARDLAFKSIHSFTLLGFSSLALSLQFSPGFGRSYVCLLFFSWLLMLISGLAGGWIILKTPIFYRINVSKIRVEEHAKNLNNQQFKLAVSSGNAFTTDGEKWTEELLASTIKIENEKIELGKRNMAMIEKRLPFVHNLQSYSFVSGVLLNIVFAMLNLY